jgi:hypothetical protein
MESLSSLRVWARKSLTPGNGHAVTGFSAYNPLEKSQVSEKLLPTPNWRKRWTSIAFGRSQSSVLS